MFPRFRDRTEAGQKLAEKLSRYANQSDVIVLALPRGGVPVAAEVATALGAPLDIYTVRKLGVPGHEELAMGAIASGGALVLNHEVLRELRLDQTDIERAADRESIELARREAAYRRGAAAPTLSDRTVILIDDGLATGATMKAAVLAVRQAKPRAIVVAVPVASKDTCVAMREIADDVVCAETPAPFHAVGIWYEDFSQTTDAEVHALLGNRATPPSPGESARRN